MTYITTEDTQQKMATTGLWLAGAGLGICVILYFVYRKPRYKASSARKRRRY